MTISKLAIFASGTGTNAQAIIEHFKAIKHIQVSLVVTNKANAGVIDVAEKNKVDWAYIPREDLADEDVVSTILEENGITHVILAGWLQLIPAFLIKQFPNKIVNIHPALLPKFGGKGMYGKHVHKAVAEANETESGITIHLVNEEYDKGKVLAQHKVKLSDSDTAETIEQKVRALELKYFPIEIENWLGKN